MKLTLKYPIGRSSAISAAPLLADGVEIGEIHADHPQSGWKGSVSHYRFYANDNGVRLGLPKIVDAHTQRGVLTLLNTFPQP